MIISGELVVLGGSDHPEQPPPPLREAAVFGDPNFLATGA